MTSTAELLDVETLEAAVSAAVRAAGWDWPEDAGLPGPTEAMRPVVLAALEAAVPLVRDALADGLDKWAVRFSAQASGMTVGQARRENGKAAGMRFAAKLTREPKAVTT